MNVIICGAGKVGVTIANQLLRDGNTSITIIDSSPIRIGKIKSLDVRTVLGFSSHPGVLSEAGAAKCDMLIAVTISDEINILTCQVAHSLFKIPNKIARIRDANYLNPKWNMFDGENICVDYVISPEIAVSEMIAQRIKMPGTESYASLIYNKVSLFSIFVNKNMNNKPITDVYNQFKEAEISGVTFIAIRRHDRVFLLKQRMHDVHLQEGDELYTIADRKTASRAIMLLSGMVYEGFNVVVGGGGNIGYNISSALQYKTNVTVIERDIERVQFLTNNLESANVIHGSMMDVNILKEINVDSQSSMVCVSDRDEVNVMASIIAKTIGNASIFTLISDHDYMDILIKNDMLNIINPRDITISKILSYINRNKLTNDVSIFNGEYNVCEIQVKSGSKIIGMSISQIESRFISVNIIMRDESIFFGSFDASFTIHKDDIIIITCEFGEFSNLDKLIG